MHLSQEDKEALDRCCVLNEMTTSEIAMLLCRLKDGQTCGMFEPEHVPQVMSHCEAMASILKQCVDY